MFYRTVFTDSVISYLFTMILVFVSNFPFPFNKHFFYCEKVKKKFFFTLFRAGSGHYTSYARHEGRDPRSCLT